LVAVYRVHPTKPVRHRYPVCSVSVRIVIARKSETRHGITLVDISPRLKQGFSTRRDNLLSWQYRELDVIVVELVYFCFVKWGIVFFVCMCTCARAPSHIAGSILGSTQKGSPLVTFSSSSIIDWMLICMWKDVGTWPTRTRLSSEAARVGGNLVFVAAGRGLLPHVLANKWWCPCLRDESVYGKQRYSSTHS
jgi:hypothetical protein